MNFAKFYFLLKKNITSRTCFKVGAQFLSVRPGAWVGAGLSGRRAICDRIGWEAARMLMSVEV